MMADEMLLEGCLLGYVAWIGVSGRNHLPFTVLSIVKCYPIAHTGLRQLRSIIPKQSSSNPFIQYPQGPSTSTNLTPSPHITPSS